MNGGELCIVLPSVGLSREAARLPKGSSQFTAYCTVNFFYLIFFFYAKDLHGINLSARFTVESIKTELFTSFQYYLHNIYINTYLIKAVKIFLECNIDLVSLLLNPGKVQVIPFRDISLCCFSVFSVMLNIKKVQLSMPPAERRQSQG